VELKKIFENLIEKDRLTHGYILFGETVSAQSEFAKQIAYYLENKNWETTNKPLIDTMVIGGGIDDVREAIKFLWQKPLKSSKKTLIVPNAQELTLQAQNAILKISEDPPNHALIILVVKNSEVLLPTLLSRFQKIYVPANSQFSISNFQTNFKTQMIKTFLSSPMAKRKEIIKKVIEDKKQLEDFVTGLIIELRHDKIKN